MKILGKGLLQFLVGRSSRDPGARGPCMIPPQEVLALISWRCAALVLVYKFFWNAHRMFLSEDLVRSSIHRRSFFNDLLKFSYSRCPGVRFWYEILMSRHRVASCAKTSSPCCSCDNVDPDLLLFHRYCCLYPAHWFPTPPHTVWGLLPEYVFFGRSGPPTLLQLLLAAQPWVRCNSRVHLPVQYHIIVTIVPIIKQ